jgi:phosphinothricin acetyltransferase
MSAAPLIRNGTHRDLEAILVIHNRAITETSAIWTDEPVDLDDRERWFAERTAAGDPVLVAEVDGVVAGYATYAQWRGKYGYRYSVEDSIYVAEGHQGRGIGRALLVELIDLATDAGKHVMIADIEASNAASLRLHESLGFVRAGLLPEIGVKFDRWLDLAILTRDLRR